MDADRVLTLEGGRNFRDMGGYPTKDGRRTRWRKLFRSGDMTSLTDADYAHLASLGVRKMCDFRATSERQYGPTRWQQIPNLSYWARDYDLSLANLAALMASETATAEEATATMLDIYRRLPAEQAPAYRELFQMLADGELPLVFNCSGGKDRTGLAAALVLTALGAPWSVIVEDYILSNTAFDYRAAQKAIQHPQAAIKISPEVAAVIGTTHPSYLETAVSAIGESYGSMDNYLSGELGITPKMLDKIQSNLLE